MSLKSQEGKCVKHSCGFKSQQASLSFLNEWKHVEKRGEKSTEIKGWKKKSEHSGKEWAKKGMLRISPLQSKRHWHTFEYCG